MFWYLILELVVDVIKVVLQERVSVRIVEQIVADATDHGGNCAVPPGGTAGAVRGFVTSL